MSLSMFKNKLYNTIIAISLVVAIAVVSTYVPEFAASINNKEKAVANAEIQYAEHNKKVESANACISLAQAVTKLENADEGDSQALAIKEIDKVIADAIKTVQKETDDVKNRTDSVEIINRAENYRKEVLAGLNAISEKVDTLSDGTEGNVLSDAQIDLKIQSIKDELEEIQKYDAPEVKYNDEAHGLIESGQTERIVGEQPVKTKTDVKNTIPEEENLSYLELNDELKQLADTFTTPAEIYEYVRNNYRYKQYTGIRLGANGTYEQREGNDLDLAALLVALFRYKGYEAKFVVGNVDIDIEKAMNWLGVSTEQAAVDAMCMLGVPTQYGQDSEGNITKLRIEHAWVKVLVPYDSYRGGGKVKGEKVWIDVDPSFKQYEKETENNVLEDLVYSEIEKFGNLSEEGSDLEEYINEGLFDAAYSEMFNISLEGNDEGFAELEKNVEEFLNNNDIDEKQVGELLGIRYIEKEETGYLPASLSYSVVSKDYEEEYLSDNLMDKVTVSLQSALYGNTFLQNTDASITFYTADLYGHKLALTYKPATAEDEEIINSYGNLFSTPSYLVRIVPVITVDGKEMLEGKPCIPGTYTNLILDIKEAGIDAVKVENPLIAGGMYGITFDYNTINDKCLESKHEELQNCVDMTQSGEMDLTEATAILANTVGEVYFSYIDYYNKIFAKATDVQWGRCISECIVGYVPKTTYIMGIPASISDGTMFIDVDTDTMGLAYNHAGESKANGGNEDGTDNGDSATDVNGYEGQNDESASNDVADNEKSFVRENGNIKNFMMLSGVLGSYMEGYVIEKTTGTPGVSSISVIKEAKARGIDIKTISEENKDEIASLKINASIKKEIEKAINNGKIVVVPEKDMYYYGFNGTGYIILNPETGEAAYMISGNLCGGEGGASIPWIAFTILVAVASVFALCVFAYGLWCSVYALMGVIFTLNQGISILDICIILLSIAGAVFSVIEAMNLEYNFGSYIITGDEDVGQELIVEALEAGVLLLIFEFTLPKLLQGVTAKFESTKFFEFISKKWGGKTINLPDNIKPSDPDMDDIKPDIDDPKPDPDPDKPDIDKPDIDKPDIDKPDPDKPDTDDPDPDDPDPDKPDPDDPDPDAPDPDDPDPDKPDTDDPDPDGKDYLEDDIWSKYEELYGEEFVDYFKPFGEDGKKILEQYGDDLLDVFDNLSDADIKKAIELANEYGDDAVELLKKGWSVDDVNVVLEGDEYVLTQSQIEEIVKIPKGSRPDPSTYLSEEYINNHLAQFEDGISIIQTEWAYNNYSQANGFVGVPDDNTLFVMPKNYCDEIIRKANGDISIIEKELGFPEGYFSDGGGLVRIDVDDITGLNVRIPSGNETGANSLWIPGGYTSGGVPEAVTDTIPLSRTNIDRIDVE